MRNEQVRKISPFLLLTSYFLLLITDSLHNQRGEQGLGLV